MGNESIRNILNEVRFARKLELAKPQLTPELYQKIREINDLRNDFSHPANNQTKINALKDRARYAEGLELLVNAMRDMNELFRNIGLG
ncbi:hypothetical protein A2797_00985 [candidate division WWE3 bacterium RIFCSPHIGHO2_01_FULL_48_15]|uniref:RiboL-PSP-HEPN domain-containing protein n=1 Tax=candidate division WWE3 bacterium RIFCSPHIGHO2_01_FULL_48_15 TaxID=1802619 RepID=A0A1F4VFY8_UNCKA|nr:MAG: hypothetical protein A2797_00985 [candidate division WWE3 bacterium RIFCSPHIGHO2_01_FULL_48_15]